MCLRVVFRTKQTAGARKTRSEDPLDGNLLIYGVRSTWRPEIQRVKITANALRRNLIVHTSSPTWCFDSCNGILAWVILDSITWSFILKVGQHILRNYRRRWQRERPRATTTRPVYRNIRHTNQPFECRTKTLLPPPLSFMYGRRRLQRS